MDITIATLLVICFVASVAALLAFVASLSQRDEIWGGEGAAVVFDKGYAQPESELSHSENLRKLDASSAPAVRWLLWSAVTWLLLGSLAGELVSLKLHWPELFADSMYSSFGRLRPVHLTVVMYGWSSLVAMACAVWMVPRLLKTPLRAAGFARAAAVIWNFALLAGVIGILRGHTDGKEFLEVHWYVDLLFVVGGGMIAVPILITFTHKKVDHLYVSLWYIAAAFVWFPMLMLLANIPNLFVGVSDAVMNWWFGHNVLGLWITPLALASAYYVIPKVLGVPVASYRLSLLGFWGLALFYSQVGLHHLIGSPVPYWAQVVSIVASVMMIVPVLAFAINMRGTTRGQWAAINRSPVLWFMLVGVAGYIASSLQGSLEAVPSFNKVVHFTHYTVAHAHLGMYGFFSMIMFGAVYFMAPRLYKTDWPWRAGVRLHWWLSLLGVLLYVVGLSIGGYIQGLMLSDSTVPFMDVVNSTVPWLFIRSAGGLLLVVAHFVFAWNLWMLRSKAVRTNEGML